jgi:aspartate-semialdehyde dehydrogenase
MSTDRRAQRIVIAGASSLLGGEVKTVLEESRFAGWDLRLVDEEDVAGTLTEAAGEAALIQRIEEDTFHGARFAFLTGSADFAKQCIGPAKEAGATILDFSRASLSDPDATPWFPKIDALTGKTVDKKSKLYGVFSAGATAIASLALALPHAGLKQLVAVLFSPVSEAGREGIEELETQTSQLLSFQSVGQKVFDAQTAFNLLPCFGSESRHDLQRLLLQTRAEVSAAMSDTGLDGQIAMNLIHAPVFYGLTFSACAEFDGNPETAALKQLCKEAGFVFTENAQAGPCNVSVAGETNVLLRDPQPDAARNATWWFWGAADNLRLPAWNGCKLAEWLEG